MRNAKFKRLSLHRETLRQLGPEEARGVVGGAANGKSWGTLCGWLSTCDAPSACVHCATQNPAGC